MSQKATYHESNSGNRTRSFPLVRGIFGLLWLLLIKAPVSLFTTRLSPALALQMILLTLPALLCTALMTIPSFLFHSPEHHAFYYFSQSIEVDPIRWFALGLATICSFIALTVPATAEQSAHS